MNSFLKFILGKKDRALGVSNEKRRYDLPLNNSVGNGFLVLLVALMTFLAVLALSASFALGDITKRWSSGLENKATIEIPAQDASGDIRSATAMTILQSDVETRIRDFAPSLSVDVFNADQARDLVAPWLGDDFDFEDVPLPGLIAIEMTREIDMEAFRAALKEVDSTITLDTHDAWLENILSLIGSLKVSTLLVTLVIALTSITAIAGAIRSRMAEHKPDVELLHLMGASDGYITGQFQRHAMIMGFKGGIAGLVAGAVILALFTLLIGDADSGLLPDFQFSGVHIFVLLVLPLFACALSAMTARFTVLRELQRMP